MYSEKRHVTIKTLKEELDVKQIVDISKMSLCRLLPLIGFQYKQEDNRKALMEKSSVVALRAEFLRKYNENGNSPFKRTVVFLDETWIFAKGNRKRSWQDGSVKGTRKPGGFEGKRYIVLHAGHSGGFVENASLIYGTASKLGDYHGDMNGDTFLKWVKEKLVPNLEEPCLIVMDNASYHSVLVEKQPISSWTKAQVIQWLEGNNINFERNQFKSELLKLAKQHARPARFVVDEYLREHGHEVLRLPPYHCQFNAIELIWAQAKQYYDTHIGEEGYGADKVLGMWQKALENCTPDRWASVVTHTEGVIDAWYNRQRILDNVPEVIITINGDDSSSDEDF
ncbi:unnamed protein product [Acanthoscelides obtectus]|uniref:Tc1-like transposase DDE domain-containing protein n=1 Tax=Acanthoscelides obtectus TaxID=200917 RepID=A0A9P0KXK1_ACAOB|nr:unnamed protein product [Acanthoscelides obtectus]CAK1637862.1 hypothetical protein AOBTE_LOCUS10241 [Acanthoscelides obtectus]